MLKVLLVDDNIITANGIRDKINAKAIEGVCVVGVAYNGKQALELSRQLLPNVVITDIKMPIMDGLTMIAELKKIMPGIELVIITSYGEFEYAKKAMAYGVSNFILKPLDLEKLDSIYNHLSNLNKRLGNITSAINIVSQQDTMNLFTNMLKEGMSDECRAVMNRLTEEVDNDYTVFVKIATDLSVTIYNFIDKFQLPKNILDVSLDQTVIAVNSAGSIPIIIDLLCALCESICQYIVDNKNFGAEQLAANIRKYIEKTYTQPNISLNSITEKFNISQSYLCAIFKKYNQVSVTTYITELRMKRAVELLKNKECNVADIAPQVGYYDAHYFMRVFKKYFGQSPSEYRKIFIKES